MPGVDRLGWRHGLIESVAEARSYGVNQVVLFPKVGPHPTPYTLIMRFTPCKLFLRDALHDVHYFCALMTHSRTETYSGRAIYSPIYLRALLARV